MSPTRSPKVRKSFRKFQISPEFITSAGIGIFVAIIYELFSRIFQNTLKNDVASFYLMGLVALICLILVAYFLIRIQKSIESRNSTQFITSKSERLVLMTQCIEKAKKSIYILSDLDSSEDTELYEHKRYLNALNKVIKDNMGNKSGFKFIRIIVPPRALGKGVDLDSNWIRDRVTGAYLEHFKLLHTFDRVALRYTAGPRDVKLMLIDDRYLFWKPDLTSDGENVLDDNENALRSLVEGGIYLEDHSGEGMSEFSECFRIMHGEGKHIKPENYLPTKQQ